jgi:ATP-dependent DNA ligase
MMYPGKAEGESWVFPPVESVNAHSKKTFWSIMVTGHGENCQPPVRLTIPELLQNKPLPAGYYATIKVDSGLVTGAVRKTPPTKVTSGKNQGKKNETNVFCQAMNDARGKYNSQMRKAHVPMDYKGTSLYPPMLAKDYKEGAVEFPCFVQRKYDGLRVVACLALTDGRPSGVILYSRTRDVYLGLVHQRKDILAILAAAWADGINLYLDGEMYAHGQSLQVISGWVRHETTPPEADALRFMVYDCFRSDALDATYSVRKGLLEKYVGPSEYVKLVETYTAENFDKVQAKYSEFISEGYEGAMLRTDAPYVFSYNGLHCANLLKLKPAFDAEFEVVGWTVSTHGKTAGAFMVICKTAAGINFDITPAMPIADRIELTEKMKQVELNNQTYFENHLLGKFITVKFGALSDAGVPLRASTKLMQRVD